MITSKEEKSTTDTPRKRVYRTVAEKKALVAQVEAGALQNVVAKAHNIAVSSLAQWIKQYASASFLANMRKRHDRSLIATTIRAIREGRLTIKEAAIQNDVHMVTVRSWIKKAKQKDADLFPALCEPAVPIDPSDTESQLRQELEAARLKIRALETMIEVAENELQIPIRKKPGAKQ